MYTKPFSDISKGDVGLVGGKAASLGEMTQAGFPVPAGFAITAQAFRDFRSKNLPDSFIREIIDQFNLLDADRVAVRSSAVAEDSSDASWAGQLESYLNTTKDSLIDRIKDCWDSIVSERAKVYAKQKKVKPEGLVVAVVVQKMIDSEASGVMFTANPITGNRDELLIEAVYGLGEGIVQGIVTPDSFSVNKQKLEFASHTINGQGIKVAYADGQTKETEVEKEQQDKQKVTDDTIRAIAELGVRIEKHYGSPQDIEWAEDDNKLYILQSRPITTLGVAQGVAGSTDAEAITSGIGASQGVVSGRVRIVHSPKDIKDVKEGEILVTHKTTPDYVEVFSKIGGVVTESGGATSHAAIISREMGIPAVVGTGDITMRVQTGDVVTIDGFGGFVYPGEIELEVPTERADFKIPIPTNDDVQDMIDAITTGINDANELWPLAPGQLMPYIDADQSVDMYDKLKQLEKEGMAEQDIAQLFERPIFIKMFLLNTGIVGMKSANVYEKRATLEDQVDFVTRMLNLAKILNQDDRNYITSRNLLWDDKQVSKFIAETDWDQTTSDFAKAINILSVNILALNWALYWDYFPEAGHELHGPYEVEGYEPNSKMVVKDYFNLASGDVWEHAKDFPYNEFRLAQIYSTDKMYINFGNRLVGDGLTAHNTHFALFVDGKRVSDLDKIQEISLEMKKLADQQTKHVNSLEPMEKVRKGAKITYFTRKKFYTHFDKDWYPEKMVEGTIKAIGTKFIDENGEAKPMSLEDKREMWDPRTDILP